MTFYLDRYIRIYFALFCKTNFTKLIHWFIYVLHYHNVHKIKISLISDMKEAGLRMILNISFSHQLASPILSKWTNLVQVVNTFVFFSIRSIDFFLKHFLYLLENKRTLFFTPNYKAASTFLLEIELCWFIKKCKTLLIMHSLFINVIVFVQKNCEFIIYFLSFKENNTSFYFLSSLALTAFLLCHI